VARRLISGNRRANRAKILQPVPIDHAGLLVAAKVRLKAIVDLPKQPDKHQEVFGYFNCSIKPKRSSKRNRIFK
jgi:hypothetical protein